METKLEKLEYRLGMMEALRGDLNRLYEKTFSDVILINRNIRVVRKEIEDERERRKRERLLPVPYSPRGEIKFFGSAPEGGRVIHLAEKTESSGHLPAYTPDPETQGQESEQDCSAGETTQQKLENHIHEDHLSSRFMED